MPERCILYAEHDPKDVFLLRTAFEQAGVTTPLRVVHDGLQAIEYLSGAGEFWNRKLHPLPCLVLLDLKLPRKSGLEVLQWIRQQGCFRNLVVIMFTSSHHAMDVEAAYELGVNSFIVKPVSVEDRLELAQLFKGWWLRFNMFAPSSGSSSGNQMPGTVYESSWGPGMGI